MSGSGKSQLSGIGAAIKYRKCVNMYRKLKSTVLDTGKMTCCTENDKCHQAQEMTRCQVQEITSSHAQELRSENQIETAKTRSQP
jgi:hypothetical protein